MHYYYYYYYYYYHLSHERKERVRRMRSSLMMRSGFSSRRILVSSLSPPCPPAWHDCRRARTSIATHEIIRCQNETVMSEITAADPPVPPGGGRRFRPGAGGRGRRPGAGGYGAIFTCDASDK